MTNELQALSKISNPFVVRFIELIKTANHYYFFYEYCNGGTLEDLIKGRLRLDEATALRYFRQLLLAFTSLIREHIMHRDLKPSNILFHNGQIKIGDFGFCKQL
jgi:serine/threonine protein kinase